MGENTMTQFRSEGQPLFNSETKETDNSSESSPDKTSADQTGSSDQNQNQTDKKIGGDETNFADHPRWKERETDWTKRFNEQEERHVGELAKIREDVDARFNSLSRGNERATTEIPPWFGGDEQQWVDYQKWDEQRTAAAEERLFKRMTKEQQQEQKAIDDATTYFQSEVQAIESDKTLNPQGKEVDRNKLLKFVLDNDLVDSKGRWNYRVAFKVMGAEGVFKAKQALTDRKNLAGATTSETRAETKPESYLTSTDFKNPANRPW